jgi:hypothetical protein
MRIHKAEIVGTLPIELLNQILTHVIDNDGSLSCPEQRCTEDQHNANKELATQHGHTDSVPDFQTAEAEDLQKLPRSIQGRPVNLVSSAFKRLTSFKHKLRRRSNTSQPSVPSVSLPSTPAPVSAISIHDPHNSDIFNLRLTSPVFASIVSHAFITHIQAHSWKFHTTNLNRLANLLLDTDLAQQITTLKFNSYRFSFNDLQTHKTLTQTLDHRRKYLHKTLETQLTTIFHLTINLKSLHITPELLSPNPPSLDHPILKQIIHLPNPLHAVASALASSGATQRLESATIFTRIDSRLLDWTHSPSSPLECASLARLVVDPTYLLDPALGVHCPNLRVLEIMHVERLSAGRLEMFLRRGYDEQGGRSVFVNLRDVVLTGSVECGCGMEEEVLYTSVVFRVVRWLGWCTGEIERLKVRRAVVWQDMARGLEEVGDVEGLKIGVMEVEDITMEG